MRRTVTLFLAIAAGLAFATPVLLPHAAAMVGGALPPDAKLARHVVIVVGSGRAACSGTAIARDLVLTAAHCVRPGGHYAIIEPGTPRRGKQFRVADFERHPSFDVETGIARRNTTDVALLKLAEPLSAKITPATLGTRDYFPVGDRFVVAGFGITGPSQGGFGTLRSALLTVVRHSPSGALRLVDPVTRGESAGLGACSGDSGGPVFESSDGALVGVVSWATDAAHTAGCGGITGATPLVRFREWIVEAAGKMGATIPPQ